MTKLFFSFLFIYIFVRGYSCPRVPHRGGRRIERSDRGRPLALSSFLGHISLWRCLEIKINKWRVYIFLRNEKTLSKTRINK